MKWRTGFVPSSITPYLLQVFVRLIYASFRLSLHFPFWQLITICLMDKGPKSPAWGLFCLIFIFMWLIHAVLYVTMWHREIPQVSAWTSNITDGIWRELYVFYGWIQYIFNRGQGKLLHRAWPSKPLVNMRPSNHSILNNVIFNIAFLNYNFLDC